jgi:hypothetical protein
MRRIALTLALFSFSVAAFAQQSAPTAAAPVAAAPAAPADVPAASPSIAARPTLGKPADGTAQLVFFRPWKFAGGGVTFKVREGDRALGTLASGRYFVVDVPPGTHSYVVHSESKDVLDLEVEAGEVYYVKGSMSMGVLVGHPNIALANEDEFAAAQKKLKRVASEADMAAQGALNRAAEAAAAGSAAEAGGEGN